jgi:hypothetical protein
MPSNDLHFGFIHIHAPHLPPNRTTTALEVHFFQFALLFILIGLFCLLA